MCVDSHEILEEVADKEEEAVAMETDEPRTPNGTEYNPLIVRRSNRAIKPTKDIDLYLLGAQYGIDLEGSEVDSSDPEFSPNRRDKSKPSHTLIHSHTHTHSWVCKWLLTE